ncbi:MAG: helix-turn-helix domain-containing protein [Nocardiopsaceae bacterium]|jgi:ribosome-binding protein aMBF1 (putative translation factor)|nr:helix-turn-helix domain-containing protein [Nocardiopsaceae bacterium]
MPKVSDLKTASRIAAEELSDPGIRREHDRTALAHAVAMRVIGYRIDSGLSQTGLARLLGMHQSAIARLEAGDHEPSLATLSRLATKLGVEFHIDITPDVFELRDTA